MIKLSNSFMIKIITKLLILIVVAKFISLGVWWYLPSEGVELHQKKNYQPKYQRVDFKNMLTRAQTQKRLKEQPVAQSMSNSGISMTNMILKGLYGTKTKGFVIVAMKSAPKKTTIVGIGEEYQGYRLKAIHKSSALFSKNAKDYILNLQERDSKHSSNKAKKKQKKSSKGLRGDQEVEERVVTRQDIKRYAKNPKQIWKEISIGEVKKNGKIIGFKVKRIDSRSKFATLGLQKGDIIIKANNIELKSYKDAIEIYKNIDKLDAIEIVVLRDNQEKELVYEIN